VTFVVAAEPKQPMDAKQPKNPKHAEPNEDPKAGAGKSQQPAGLGKGGVVNQTPVPQRGAGAPLVNAPTPPQVLATTNIPVVAQRGAGPPVFPTSKPTTLNSSGSEKGTAGASKIQKIAEGVIEKAAKIGEHLESNKIERTSKAIAKVTDKIARKSLPDSLAKGIYKVQDATQSAVLAIGRSSNAQKILKATGVMSMVIEGKNAYTEAHDGGLSRTASAINAAGVVAGKIATKEMGFIAGMATEALVSAGSRGYAIGFDAVAAAVTKDRAALEHLSDAAAAGNLGRFAKAGDKIGDWIGAHVPMPQSVIHKYF